MNHFEYKKAYRDIVPSEELIHNTLLKIKEQKRNRVVRIRTNLQTAVAAGFCVIVGIGASNITSFNGSSSGVAGSVFGKGSAWVLAVLLFAVLVTVIALLNKRRK